ncbi:hypothetical protein PM8797T_22943 [Gimesia maris DSM 8797]|nr:hypothetical protein PM8797T_22943 [Gimesia maris DSM 8797]
MHYKKEFSLQSQKIMPQCDQVRQSIYQTRSFLSDDKQQIFILPDLTNQKKTDELIAPAAVTGVSSTNTDPHETRN